MTFDQDLDNFNAGNISSITENELPTGVSNQPELLSHTSSNVELSPSMSNPIKLPDLQNSVKLNETNPISNTPNEFIIIPSNGINQNPVTEMTEQLHVSCKT